MVLELHKDCGVFGTYFELIGELEEDGTWLEPVSGG